MLSRCRFESYSVYSLSMSKKKEETRKVKSNTKRISVKPYEGIRVQFANLYREAEKNMIKEKTSFNTNG